MARVIHRHPDDCIPQMGFDCYDGGRSDYFNLRLGMDVPNDIQDCAVVAVSVALTYYPRVSSSPALSYSATLSELRNMNLRKRPWMSKGFRETRKKFVVRRFREIIEERRKRGTAKHKDPKYGVNTVVLSRVLRSKDFSFEFGEPPVDRPICLCSSKETFVIDGVLTNGNDHSFALINGTIVADYDFRKHFDGFHVMHIWQRH